MLLTGAVGKVTPRLLVLNVIYLTHATEIRHAKYQQLVSTCCYNKSTCSYNKSTFLHKPFFKQHDNKKRC